MAPFIILLSIVLVSGGLLVRSIAPHLTKTIQDTAQIFNTPSPTITPYAREQIKVIQPSSTLTATPTIYRYPTVKPTLRPTKRPPTSTPRVQPTVFDQDKWWQEVQAQNALRATQSAQEYEKFKAESQKRLDEFRQKAIEDQQKFLDQNN